jgi:hypothetical protein
MARREVGKRVRSRAPIAWLVVATLLMTAGAAHAATVDRPAFTPGDFWTYRTNSTLDLGFSLEGSLTYSVRNRESVALEGDLLDVYRVDLTGEGEAQGTVRPPYGSGVVAGQWSLTGQELVETQGMKVVHSVFDIRVNGTYEGLIAFRFRVVNTTSFRVLLDGWTFPLAEGDSGDVAFGLNYSQDASLSYGLATNTTHSNGTASWTIGYSMTPAASIVTPAGTFLAYRITESLPEGSVDLAYYSPTVGANGRTETYNGSGDLVGTTELLAYRYQAGEPATFLGVPLAVWGIAATVAAVAMVTILYARHRRGRKRRPAPPCLQEPKGGA